MFADAALEELKAKIDGHTAFVGLGNRDRGDDAFGLRFIDDMKYLRPDRFLSEEEGLESVVLRLMNDSEVKRVVFVDSCDLAAMPGSVSLLRLDSIDETISTHKVPLAMLMALLQNAEKETFLLGVQPKSLGFGEGLSDELENVLNELKKAVRSRMK